MIQKCQHGPTSCQKYTMCADVVAPIVVIVLHVYPTAYMCCNQNEGNIRQCLDL